MNPLSPCFLFFLAPQICTVDFAHPIGKEIYALERAGRRADHYLKPSRQARLRILSFRAFGSLRFVSFLLLLIFLS